ncbi:hypothetical protein AZE42_07472 [Rhizopogon vesiculosus]|uniref:Uncharacterized protein n=1 Tax=Rhizopogon vesiculosus TaxID=180088 RepID=A0A1J8Q6N6_9AGAM|nr:hypothetical protein AZE42_07472 [Rhizopogon vesiculosus]
MTHAIVRISHIPANVQALPSRDQLVKSPEPRPNLAGQDDIEQFESSFTETHFDHMNMAELEM